MSEAFTAKNYRMKDAPKRIELLGDKYTRPESAQHIIEFPGGAIELSRTGDGNYWAHIIVNRDWACDDIEGRKGAIGEVVATRVNYDGGPLTAIRQKPQRDITQIAVLIKPTSEGSTERKP